MPMLPVTATANIVRGGIANALKGSTYTAYSVSLFPTQQRGQISLTVESSTGRERSLTFLLGERTNEDVAACNPGPDHEVHVVYDLVTARFIEKFVRDWLAKA